MTTSASGTSSLRQLARLIGVSEKAVRKAKAAGVFSTQAVGRDEHGAPVVLDLGLAVSEWERSGRRLRGTTRRPPPAIATPATRRDEEDQEPDGDLLPPLPDVPSAPPGDGGSSPSLVDAQTTAMLERARKLKLENDEREGKLLDVTKASREAFEFARTLREQILNIPARLSAELAAEPDATRVYMRLDGALRDALAATAATLEATANVGTEGAAQ